MRFPTAQIKLPTVLFFLTTLVSSQSFPVRQLAQLPPSTFLENLLTFSDGHILITEVLIPRLWSYDTISGSNLTLVYEFDGFTSLTGTAEIGDNLVAVIASNVTVGASGFEFQAGSSTILKLDFSQGETPIISTLSAVTDAYFLNGLTFVPSANALFASDSLNGTVFAVDIDTGVSTVAIDDPLMKACAGAVIPLSINGIRYHYDESEIYFTNSACGTLNKIKISPDGTPVDQAVTVGKTKLSLDDFALTRDGTAYIADGPSNTILRMRPDGSYSAVAGNLNSSAIANPTSAQFGKSKRDLEKGTLYVTTSGGLEAPINGTAVVGAQLVAIDLKSGWQPW